MDSLLSFPVGLFHPLQHAGLSRRSPVCRPSGSWRSIGKCYAFSQVIESECLGQPGNRFGNVPTNDCGRRVSVGKERFFSIR